MPTFNEEKGIAQFLRQFKNQTLSRGQFELIVVDGGSTDKTREVAKKHADQVFIQTSKGVGGARNDGVKAAKAEIIATTDADVTVSHRWLEQILSHFDKDPDLVLLFGTNFPATKSKAIWFFSRLKSFINKIFATFHIAYLAEGPNTAFKKTPFLEVGGYSVDMPVMDDTEITSRLRKVGTIKYDYGLVVYASIRRLKKKGTSQTGFVLLTSYFKFVLFGKESLSVKYSKEQY